MQGIDRQAKKNGVVLINYGSCQFCGSDTKGGVYECFNIYNNILDWPKLEAKNTSYGQMLMPCSTQRLMGNGTIIFI